MRLRSQNLGKEKRAGSEADWQILLFVLQASRKKKRNDSHTDAMIGPNMVLVHQQDGSTRIFVGLPMRY